ncbi:hypothetical protein ILYODFUR_003935 [Ilyodon furcidens]|uniref:Uncharacterized protein n=1 Tax=Ilyodon furcidens TaxID=33524 RepID=A0ABV0SKE5_9TELE
MHKENIHIRTYKKTLLPHKYFCEQDVGKDKHSSWLLNRSTRQCVVHSMCVQFSLLCLCVCVCVKKWPRWELEVIKKSLLCVCWSACVLFLSSLLSVCAFPPRRYLEVPWSHPGSDTQV